MPQAQTDVVAAQLEAVTPLLTGMYDKANTLYNRFQKIMVSEQSGRDNRMPMLLRPGGYSVKADFDGGDLKTGSGPKFDYTAMSPIDWTYNISWTLKTKFTTDSTKKAVVDTVQLTIAESIKEARTRMDKYLNLDNQYAVLGTATAYTGSGGGGSDKVYTFGTGGLRARPFRAGDMVTVQQGTSSLGDRIIKHVDYENNKVTLTVAPTGSPAASDKLLVYGCDAASTTNAFFYPISYSHNNSTSGSFLGKTRVDYPEFWTPTVDGNSGALTPDLLNQALIALDVILGEDVRDTGDWFWYLHPKLQYNLIQYQTTISEITFPMGGANKQVDLGHSRRVNRVFSQIPIETAINADETRVDLFDGKNWLRCVYKEIGWIPLGGKTVLPVPNSTGYDAAEQSWFGGSQQFAARNARRGVYISSLDSGL